MTRLHSLAGRTVGIATLVFCLLASLAPCQLWGQGPVITTVAGNGTPGFSGDNGPAITAQLNVPYSVAVDSAGNLYIPDFNNKRIRKVDTSGIITTIAGNGTAVYAGDNGPATSASLNCPYSVAVDTAGNLYIADYFNQRIRKVDTKGIITTIAGNGFTGYAGDNGPATSASLYFPYGVAVDSAGNLYISEPWNQRVRKVDTNGIITTVAGNGTVGYAGDNGPAASARLNMPRGVAVDSAGNLYIADQSNQRIRKVDTKGIITTIAGNGSPAYAGDNGPAASASLNYPSGVAVDSTGNVYIADLYNQRVRNVDPNGIITTIAGTETAGYAGDNGPATNASLSYPYGVAVDSAGNLYIADTSNFRVRKVTLNKAATHFALSAPASVPSETALSFTVTALDQFDNPVAGYRGTVHFASTDVQALMLPPDYTFTALDNGMHTFSATLKTAGTQTITATDTAKASVFGTSDVITVTDFSLNTIAPVTLFVGGSGSAQISVNSLFGFNSAVALRVSGTPAGVTAFFSNSSVTPPAGGSGYSTLNVAASPVTLPSTFTLTVSGDSGGLTHSATVSVTVSDFSLNAVAPITLLVGASGSAQVSVNSIFGFNSPVALSVSGMPTGVTAAFSSSSVTPPAGGSANSTLNIGISPVTLPSTFTLTVSGDSGGLTHAAMVTVTVITDTSSVKNLINQVTTAGCIDNLGVANSLVSKVISAESAIRAGDVQTATDLLTALLQEVYAQSGKHIAASCTIGGAAFSPVDILTVDIQALIPTATLNVNAGRRMGQTSAVPKKRR